MTLILSGTDGLSDVDGSAATPAIRGTDTNTGIFFPAADTIAFSEGGTESMRIDSSGNVGIGTSSPAVKLHIETSSGSAAFFVNSPSATDVGSYISLRKAGSAKFLLGVESALGGTSDNGALYVYGANALTMYTNGSERARIDSSGNWLVGTTSTSPVDVSANGVKIGQGNINIQGFQTVPVVVGRASTTGTLVDFYYRSASTNNVGFITTNGTGVTYNTASDHRLKENIQPMTGALAKVAALKPCTYKWKADGSEGEGFIAHELQAVVPQCVTGEKDAVDAEGKPVYQGIDTSFLVATLTAAIQEQQAIIQSLTARIEALEGK